MGTVQPPEVTRAYGGEPACGAHKRSGSICVLRKGWGTSHLGYGRCRLHGGNTPNGIKAALQEQVELEMERARMSVMGTAIDIDPMEALLWCVRISAGEVAYATQKVHSLTEDDVIVNPEQVLEREGGRITEERTVFPDELNLWIKVRQVSMERLAKFSKMALDAGVAERQVRLAEGAGEQLAVAIRSILVGLQLTAEQEKKAPDLVRDALELLEGSNPAGQALLSS